MTGEMSFKCLIFWQYCQESLEPKEKSIVERACNNSNRLLAINYFRKKALS